MLIQPLQRIEVVNSSKQCKAGSTGYIVCGHWIGAYNLVDHDIIFTRFGKNGKPRISLVKLVTAYVDVESLSFREEYKHTMDKIIRDYLMPLRWEGRRASPIDSSIKVIPIGAKDLTELGIWEFIAYISALSMFVKAMEHIDLGMPRIRIDDILGTPVAETRPSSIGHCICESFKNTEGRLDQKFDEYINYFSDVRNRKIWIKKLRKQLSLDRQAVIRYSKGVLAKHNDLCLSIKNLAKDQGIRVRTPAAGG